MDAETIVGALRLIRDETGDCYLFAQNLKKLLLESGVDFQFNQPIEALTHYKGVISGLKGRDRSTWYADKYIIAAGYQSRSLMNTLSLNLPIYPVKGYSLTAPIIDFNRAPQSTLLDDYYKVSITRLGDHIRIGGMAEFSGEKREPKRKNRAILESIFEELFPNVVDFKRSTFWMGARPMTPDGPPIISPIHNYSNLYLNSGHGTFGWTMGLASGKMMADLISGVEPTQSPYPFRADRF